MEKIGYHGNRWCRSQWQLKELSFFSTFCCCCHHSVNKPLLFTHDDNKKWQKKQCCPKVRRDQRWLSQRCCGKRIYLQKYALLQIYIRKASKDKQNRCIIMIWILRLNKQKFNTCVMKIYCKNYAWLGMDYRLLAALALIIVDSIYGK